MRFAEWVSALPATDEDFVEIVAHHLRIPEVRVLVASTGIIGRYLPMDRIRPALPKPTR